MIDLDLRVKMISQYPCTVGQNYYEVGRKIEKIAGDTNNSTTGNDKSQRTLWFKNRAADDSDVLSIILLPTHVFYVYQGA